MLKKRLRISFDALDDEEKQVFMDVACFFWLKPRSTAERILEGSGWNAHNAIETLKDKCLIEEVSLDFFRFFNKVGPVLRMHDHLRDLGRELAVELSPPHRLWRPQDLKPLELMGFKTILARTDVRCFHSIFDESMGSKVTFFIGQSNNFFETSGSLSWLQLEGNSSEQPSIPSWIPLQNLQYLKIKGEQLKTLWENSIQTPSQLKELQISETSLKEFPDLENGKAAMSGLEKLEIEISGENFVSKILISGIDYPSLKSIKLHGMENLMEVNLTSVKTLNCLDIKNCKNLERVRGTSDLIKNCKNLERVRGTSDLTNLVLLNISQCPELKKLTLGHSSCLKRITIVDCKHLKSVSGISNLAKLVELEISDCGKLEFEYLRLRGMNCLKSITFGKGVNVKYLELEGCQILKTLEFGCEELVELIIRGCPELKKLPCFIGASCLERIIIDGCEIWELRFNGCQNLRSVSGNFGLTRLNISQIPELKQLSLGHLSCLERITIVDCEHLKSVSGISNLAKLVELEISACGKLAFEYLRLRGMNSLKSLKIDKSVKVKYFELEGCQNLKTLVFGCEELVELIIRGCPEVKKLPYFIGASYLERIIIDGCEIWALKFNGCLELEELQFVANVSLKLVIESCEKLQNISGIEEMHPPMFMRLCYCSNAVIRSCIHKLKSVPSEGMEMIGRAADGAESSLNENLFCDAHIAVDAVTGINPMERSCLCCLSSLIGCFLVVVDSSTSVMDINNSLPAFIVESDFPMQVREGEWIIMIGVMNKFWYGWSNEYVEKISGVSRRKGIMKKGFWVKVKGGEEWKILGVLRIIVDKLYHL